MRLSGRDVTCVRGGREVFSGLDFESDRGRGAGRDRPQRRRQDLAAAADRGPAAPAGGSIALDGGEAELTLAEQCHYLGHRDALKPALTRAGKSVASGAIFSAARPAMPAASLARVGTRPRRPSAGRLPLRRPAAAAVDRAAACGAAAGLAAGRADLGARCGRPGAVRRPDARASRRRRPDRRRDPRRRSASTRRELRIGGAA